jgi:hypothetical protein
LHTGSSGSHAKATRPASTSTIENPISEPIVASGNSPYLAALRNCNLPIRARVAAVGIESHQFTC